ncbi:antibiotic biosynthesis monooxygenase [Streptosporangium soli]|nr:antibiotic biosynthesis monooxygenase [Streptosporangium sp. KLBMP 9127]
MTRSEPVFRVVLRMTVRHGAGPEFERAWLAVARGIAAHPANRGQWLMLSADAYYVFTDWVDRDSFHAFETSQEHVRNRALLEPYRTGASMITMHTVHDVPRTGAAE